MPNPVLNSHKTQTRSIGGHHVIFLASRMAKVVTKVRNFFLAGPGLLATKTRSALSIVPWNSEHNRAFVSNCTENETDDENIPLLTLS